LLESKTEKELWVEELEEFRAAYVKEYSPVATNVKVVKTVVKVLPSPKTPVKKAPVKGKAKK
jgi:hypothetical protein